MKTISLKHKYKFPTKDVHSVLVKPETFQVRMNEQGAIDIVVVNEGENKTTYEYSVKREMPNFIPRLIRKEFDKMAGMISLRHEEEWLKEGDRYTCNMNVVLDKLKINVKSKTTYTPDADDETLIEQLMEIRCDIPLVGKKNG